MSAARRICLLGFGEVGQALGEDLGMVPGVKLSTFDIQFDNPASVPSLAIARAPGIHRCEAPSDAAANAELVISAVTAAQDIAAARSVADSLAPGAFYLDVNSVSPGTKRRVFELVAASGARYVEAAVMAPIFPKRIAVPMLTGGPHAEAFCAAAAELGFTGAEFCSARIGVPSATKMCRSVIIKGMESLLTESMLAARRYGVEQNVLASLDNLLATDDWEELARYMLSRSLEHGQRRAQEMREAAETLREAGVSPWMSLATVERQLEAAGFAAARSRETLAEMLDEILEEMTTTEEKANG